MAKPQLSLEIREFVMQRAFHCCEYCKSRDKYAPHYFTIDHIIALSLGGTDAIINLAYACFPCNRLKSNKPMLFDYLTEEWVAIFNPRIHSWNEHFSWSEDATLIYGTTAIGRSAVTSLKLNREKLIEYRKSILPLGEHPPS
jgi:hypothetical protein